MDYRCPGCSGTISIDLTSVRSYILRMKCPRCNKGLVLNDCGKSFVEQKKQDGLKSLEHMIDVSLADGNISDAEKRALLMKSKEYGVEEAALEEIIKRKVIAFAKDSVPVLEEEYSENIASYLDTNGSYDWMPFAKIISDISQDNPNLPKYRNDLLRMLTHNADKFKELVRQYEEIYNESQSSADWDEILEHKNQCNEIARSLRALRNELEGKNRRDFILYLRELTAPREDAW